ncbi:ABC transporter substrate-binding protein [Microtetraspora malaysiensis]|uniref:ABC transporter substrate-binding protein n=1 Tax=Microtetraspora malaysiensis TaxID=161358 RepID=UPI003D8B2F4C
MKKHLALTAAGLVLAGTAGCGGSAPSASEQVKIMVGGIDKVIYLPAKLSEQLGNFTQEGLNVQLLTEPAGAQAENVMLSGDVHGVVGFYDHSVDLQAKGKCVKSVVQFADVPGEVEIVAADKADAITGPQDFAGKKLGITSPGSSTDFLTQYLAVKHGVAPESYTRVKAGAGATFISAIENGGIDAGMTTDPTAAQLVTTGKGKVFIDMRTKEGTRAALGGLYPASSLYMTCEWVDGHKEIAQKLANAFVRTLRWINAHSAQEIADKMPAEFKGADETLYVKAVNDSKGMFTDDGIMPDDGPKNVLEVLSAFSPDVKAKKDQIDLSKTFTTEFTSKVPQS